MQRNMIGKIIKSEDGATVIEYGLIVAGIGATLSIIFYLCGDTILEVFTFISGAISH